VFDCDDWCEGSECPEMNDDDGDGVLDENDSDPFNPNLCSDIDGDDCDDCSVGGSYDPMNDGYDYDGDGACDAGDTDDDNDGVPDDADCDPQNEFVSEVDVCGVCGGDNTSCPTVTDIDGNVYTTVQIGAQLWMQENLKVTHHNNEDEITHIINDEDWGSYDVGQYGVYDNDFTNADIYGNLYNWAMVDDDRGVCPEGWHIPSDDEYTGLIDYLGGEYVAGGKMKEAGLEHWCGYYQNYPDNCINESATNESGFTALPAGSRHVSYGDYSGLGRECYFWTSDTEDIGVGGYGSYRRLEFDESRLVMGGSSFRFGFSVRCIKD
jgi:uncharacterized protein (TIGR02145 family)